MQDLNYDLLNTLWNGSFGILGLSGNRITMEVVIIKWGSTLRRARMPGACRSCLRAHKLLWLRARQGKWFLQSGHALIFTAVYITFTGLVKILAGHLKIFPGHVNLQNHVPDGHVNQMLNVKPCLSSQYQSYEWHRSLQNVVCICLFQGEAVGQEVLWQIIQGVLHSRSQSIQRE